MGPVAPDGIDPGHHSANSSQKAKDAGGGTHHQGGVGKQSPGGDAKAYRLHKKAYRRKNGGGKMQVTLAFAQQEQKCNGQTDA